MQIIDLINRIGFAIAQRLSQEGASVVISSRKPKNVEAATEKLKAEGGKVSGIVCHVSKKEDREKLFQEVFILVISLLLTIDICFSVIRL